MDTLAKIIGQTVNDGPKEGDMVDPGDLVKLCDMLEEKVREFDAEFDALIEGEPETETNETE